MLYAKWLERGRFVWPQAKEGTVSLIAAQPPMLVEGIDWRQPAWTAHPPGNVQHMAGMITLNRLAKPMRSATN